MKDSKKLENLEHHDLIEIKNQLHKIKRLIFFILIIEFVLLGVVFGWVLRNLT